MPQPKDEFFLDVRRAQRFIKKQERFRNNSEITDQDLRFVYEITFLSIFVAFENFIEDQFVGLVAGKPWLAGAAAQRRMVVRTPQIAREAIYGGYSYKNFIPYESTLKLAEIYFRNGKPFTNLSSSDHKQIDMCQLIRNVIAHKSKAAENRFEREILSNITLRPSQRTPAGYLKSQFSSTQTRFEHHASQLVLIVNTLSM